MAKNEKIAQQNMEEAVSKTEQFFNENRKLIYGLLDVFLPHGFLVFQIFLSHIRFICFPFQLARKIREKSLTLQLYGIVPQTLKPWPSYRKS